MGPWHRQTLDSGTTTSYGALGIDGFTIGYGCTTDMLDYASNVTSVGGTPKNTSSNLDLLTEIPL